MAGEVNGKRRNFGQRFAIDWMRLDDKGRLLNGAEPDLHSYAAYGADVIAVTDGKVVAILDKLKEQTPGTLPDMSTITLENIDGNHVILDLGGGAFAFYAHLQPGSIGVSIGEHVKRGQVLGKLGNTGNTSAPRSWHFRNPSVHEIPRRNDSIPQTVTHAENRLIRHICSSATNYGMRMKPTADPPEWYS